MPYKYIWYVNSYDYIITRDTNKLLRTINNKDFWYTIKMNRYFQIVYLDSDYFSDDENPLEICKMINTLNNFIRDDLK